MQLHKFYGRTLGGVMAQIKRELGPDALILETNLVKPDNPAAPLNPGARFEILAARDPHVQAFAPAARRAQAAPLRWPDADQNKLKKSPPLAPLQGHGVLEDLGLLRAQLTQLLEQDLSGKTSDPAGADLSEYHDLIELGVDHQVLAGPFRRWLQWRTAPPGIRTYIAQIQRGAAARMRGESLREWLWLTWSERQGLPAEEKAAEKATGGPEISALLGPTGGGKTTTLAKMASIFRQKSRQNAVVLTLDTHRFGATEQWRRWGKLMGIAVEEIVTPADLSRSMEHWKRFDWIGIDTPGGMTPECEAGRRYGSILAQCPFAKSVMVLPVTQQESLSREQMKRGRAMGISQVLFSKVDETTRRGGILNLTMDGQWKIAGFATGPRVPEDWEAASGESLWRRVLAPAGGGVE